MTAWGLPPYEDDAVHGPNAQIAAVPETARRMDEIEVTRRSRI
jgi:hypothetical protein